MEQNRTKIIYLASILFIILIIITIILGYFFNWDWVGVGVNTQKDVAEPFRSKTLWDWLDLIIVPLILAVSLFCLTQQEERRERFQEKQDRERDEIKQQQEAESQQDNQRQASLLNYFDKMSELILDKQLGEKADDGETEVNPKAAIIARVLTLAVLRELNPSRVETVFRFISDADLVGIISFKDGDLRMVDWTGINLLRANLIKANLRGAKLRGADLRAAKLQEANLRGANLREADLIIANLSRAKLDNANLRKANLSKANLSRADLNNADLSNADLSAAINWTREQLQLARSLEGATMPDGRLYSDWLLDEEE